MKRLFALMAITLLAGVINLLDTDQAHAYTNSRIIDNSVFDNTGTMSAGDIQNFLNTFPDSCIKNYQAPYPQDWYNYGGNVSAASVIRRSADLWGLNPQVILTTLEKEEGLVSGHGAYGCSSTAFNSSMGYDCPGPMQPATNSCVRSPSNLGFSAQVSHGAWQLSFGRHRSEGDGNLGWDGDNTIQYYGYMTEGSRARVQGGAVNYYSGYVTLSDNATLYLENGATASLYSYTPYIQSFGRIFEGWFGSTWGVDYASNYAGQSGYPTIPAGTSAQVYLMYRNGGNRTWYDDISASAAGQKPVHLSTAKPVNRTSAFANLDGSSWCNFPDGNRAACTFAAVYESDGTTLAANQHAAKTGQVVKFSFRFKVPVGFAPGAYREWFQPIVEGQTTMNDPGTFLDIVVPLTDRSSYAAQSTYPTLIQGQSTTSFISYKNVGNQAWYDNVSLSGAPAGTKPVHLATSRPLNRASALGVGWNADQNRPAGTFAAVYESDGTTLAANQNVAQPGQIAKFSFTLTAPAGLTPQTYREWFQPIMEGGVEMNDPSTFLDVTVVRANYTAAYAGQSGYPTIIQGQTAPAWFKYKNVGNMPWYDDVSFAGGPAGSRPLHLATSGPINRNSALALVNTTNWCNHGDRNRAACTFGAVYGADGTTLAADQHIAQPGQIVKFDFSFGSSTSTSPQTYREAFQPILEGGSAMNNPGTFLDVTVQAQHYLSSYFGQSAYPTLSKASGTAPGYIMYKNIGNVAWFDDTTFAANGQKPVHLATSNPINRSSTLGSGWNADRNRPAGTFAAVYEADGTTLAADQHIAQPGQVTKFAITFNAASSVANGSYREWFQPIVEGQNTMNNPGTFLDVNVTN